MKSFSFDIKGQIRGGKNSILINRSGHRYPNPKWAKWRDTVIRGIQDTLKSPVNGLLIDKPCRMRVIYTPNDLKRRDMPAMLDSILHILEKVRLIKDDCLITDLEWISRPKDKETSGASIFVEEIEIEV